MKFPKKFLQELRDGDDNVVFTDIYDHRRWTVHHRRVFKHDGKFYETHFSRGATEQQDEGPYEYDSAEIECAEVVLVEKLILVYEKAATPAESNA